MEIGCREKYRDNPATRKKVPMSSVEVTTTAQRIGDVGYFNVSKRFNRFPRVYLPKNVQRLTTGKLR